MVTGASVSWTSPHAMAQVYKCTDAQEQVRYADAPCGAASTQDLLEGQRSADDIERERSAAAQAQERKYRQRALEQESRMQLGQAQQSQARAPLPADSPACKDARKELQFVSGIRTISQDEKRMRVNAAIAQVNAACGTNTPLMQEPDKVIIDHGGGGAPAQ